jgi:hypothetical protein
VGRQQVLVGLATALPYTRSLYSFNVCVLPQLRCGAG